MALVIRGSNLQGVRAVRFGGRAGTIIGHPGRTSVKVRTPNGLLPGVMSVQLSTEAGWTAANARAHYTVVARPTLDTIAPADGYFSGGQRVT